MVTLLLVEDNPGDIHLMRDALAQVYPAVTLHIVRDGDEALAFVRHEEPYSNAPWPNLILLDLYLPGKSGHEVLHSLKADAVLRTIPVVVLSRSDAQPDVLAAYGAHANAYVVKPSDYSGFVEMSRALEYFWLRNAVLPKLGGVGRR